MQRRLIINADDFGRSSLINEAVIEAHRRGILTSASLMVTGDAAQEAVAMAKQHPALAVGLHVVVVDGKPALPPAQIPALVNDAGLFPAQAARLGVRYFFSTVAREQVARELRAQFEAFAATGLCLSHVDGHQHMHVHPAIFAILMPLALEFGAKGFRLPLDDLLLGLQQDRQRVLSKIGWAIAFGFLSRYCQRKLRGQDLTATCRTYGLMQTGQMSEPYVERLLGRLSARSAEIYFHPTTGPRMEEFGPNPIDYQTLLSPRMRQIITRRKLRLSTYLEAGEL